MERMATSHEGNDACKITPRLPWDAMLDFEKTG
jgi:hypothetical protein